MTQINLQIGHKIRIKRRKLGVTQANLSKKLSISPSYLNLIESGKRKVNVDLLLKLANELNIEISDITKKTDTNLYQNLMDLLGDNLFEDLDITNFELKELVWSIKKDMVKKNNLNIKKKIKFYAEKHLKKVNFLNKIEYKDLNFLIRDKYFKNRILLFGDSLHTIHPFVGQGFNMTLRDLLCLEKILLNKINLGLDVGSLDILSEFSNESKPRNFIQSIGIDLMKNSFSFKKKSIVKARNEILKTLNKSNLVKNIFYNIADKGIKF